jgi:hypothetical protein
MSVAWRSVSLCAETRTAAPAFPARSVATAATDLVAAQDDARARRPGACRRPQPRAKAGANRRPASNVPDRAERGRAGPPPPGRRSGHARPVRGRRVADAARHAIGLFDIGARRRRHDRRQPAAGAPWSAARRPDRLAFYMGYCPHRRKGHVSCGTRDGRTLSRSRTRPTYLLVVAGRRLAGTGSDAGVSSAGGALRTGTRALPPGRKPAPGARCRVLAGSLGCRPDQHPASGEKEEGIQPRPETCSADREVLPLAAGRVTASSRWACWWQFLLVVAADRAGGPFGPRRSGSS